ncbi:MAG: ATP-binding protein [Bacteroidales bacterium]|nr:ATP-binding protein [Candidatus Liminaster caballi]
MNPTSSAEKEWLRKIQSGRTDTASSEDKKDQQSSGAPIDPTCSASEKSRKHGFQDVAGMEALKSLITESFINVLNNREIAQAYGILPPSLMFYGPAGCGKTYFAERVAEEVGVNFMKVVPDDIASKWVHGTQEKIAEVFRKAERNAPTLLFFDEFDAMVPARTGEDYHNQNNEVNEFLCMMNNASEKGIYIIAATNHPESIDKAALRTGRIDELIYIDMPDKASRESLFRLSLSKLPTSEDVDYEKLAEMTSGYNCSDISYIVKLASRKMFNESIAQKDKPYKLITQMQLEEAIKHKSPSVSQRDLREYERVRSEFSPMDKGRKPVAIGFH